MGTTVVGVPYATSKHLKLYTTIEDEMQALRGLFWTGLRILQYFLFEV